MKYKLICQGQGRIPVPELFHTKNYILSYLRKEINDGNTLKKAIENTKTILEQEFKSFEPDSLNGISQQEFKKEVYDSVDKTYDNAKRNDNYIKDLDKKYSRKGCLHSILVVLGIPTIIIVGGLAINSLENKIKEWQNRPKVERVIEKYETKLHYYDSNNNNKYDSLVEIFPDGDTLRLKLKREASKQELENMEIGFEKRIYH